MRCRTVVVALAVMLALIVFVPIASAQASGRVPQVGYFADLGIVSAQVDSIAADQARIGSRGIGGLMGFGLHLNGIVVAGLQGEVQWVKDKDPFGNSTTGGYMTSGTGLYDFSLYGGLRTPFLGSRGKTGVRFGGNVGRSWFGGRRSIGNCIDCDEEGLDVGGGVYYEPIITIGKAGGLNVSASYRAYGKQSDVRNMFIVSVTIWH